MGLSLLNYLRTAYENILEDKRYLIYYCVCSFCIFLNTLLLFLLIKVKFPFIYNGIMNILSKLLICIDSQVLYEIASIQIMIFSFLVPIAYYAVVDSSKKYQSDIIPKLFLRDFFILIMLPISMLISPLVCMTVRYFFSCCRTPCCEQLVRLTGILQLISLWISIPLVIYFLIRVKLFTTDLQYVKKVLSGDLDGIK